MSERFFIEAVNRGATTFQVANANGKFPIRVCDKSGEGNPIRVFSLNITLKFLDGALLHFLINCCIVMI